MQDLKLRFRVCRPARCELQQRLGLARLPRTALAAADRTACPLFKPGTQKLGTQAGIPAGRCDRSPGAPTVSGTLSGPNPEIYKRTNHLHENTATSIFG